MGSKKEARRDGKWEGAKNILDLIELHKYDYIVEWSEGSSLSLGELFPGCSCARNDSILNGYMIVNIQNKIYDIQIQENHLH